MSENRYVQPAGRGWDIIKEGHARALDRGRTKAEAVKLATELTQAAGGGEVRVLNREGKLTERTTVTRGDVRRKTAA